jgi:hypothetical protein
MNLTKTQTTVAAVLMCAAPIVYEANALRESERAPIELRSQLADVQAGLENSHSLNQSLENELSSLGQTLAMLRTPLPAPTVVEPAPKTVAETPRPDGWREDLPYVEIPKELLAEIEVIPVNAAGEVTEELADVLSLTGDEIAAVENTVSAQLKKWHGLEAAAGRYERGYIPETKRRSDYLDMFTMRFPALPEQGGRIRRDLEDGVRTALGDERADLFFKYGQEWVEHMFSSGGTKERLITITRTGDAVGTVDVQTQLFKDGTNLGSNFHQIWTSPDDHAIANLHSLPAPLQIIATRWHLNDRPR